MSVPQKPTPRPKPAKSFKVMSDLLRDTSPRAAGVEELLNAKEIRPDRIVPDPTQPRKTFPQESLDELAASIRTSGILQAILVRYDRETDYYVIIDGERRWRAAQLAGVERIPALVRDDNQSEAARLVDQLMANIQREDLNAVDRAEGLKRLKEAMGGVSWEQVAEKVGLRRSRLFQLLDLLDTNQVLESERQAIRAGELTEKHSRVLRHLSGSLREGLQRVIAEDKISAQEAKMASDALVRNPHMHLHTPVEQVVQAVRQIRAESKRPRPPEPRMNLRDTVPGASTLPVIDDNAIADVREYAEQLQRYLLAMSSETLSPAQVKRVRPAIRRLRDAADLFLDSAKE